MKMKNSRVGGVENLAGVQPQPQSTRTPVTPLQFNNE